MVNKFFSYDFGSHYQKFYILELLLERYDDNIGLHKDIKMEHKTITNDHGTYHYWTEGDGNVGLVFTHGATMDHGLFNHQINHFSNKYKVIVWDVPCHGLSRPYTSFSLQQTADDLFALLIAEKINTVHLVGQSMGGYISQIMTADHPELISSITTIGSSPIQLSYYSKMDRWLLSITPILLKFYNFKFLIKMMSNQIALTAGAKKYALETLSGLNKGEVIHIMGAVYRGLIEYDKDKLGCPIFITYGDKDITGKVKAYCDRWAHEENRLLTVISHAAHNAHMDNPDEFNQVLNRFLNSISTH